MRSAIKPKKLLIITSSGGGGLLQTANAKQQEALALDPNLQIVKKDLLKDWVPFGKFFVQVWNRAQQSGRVSVQQIVCANGQPIWDFCLFPAIFLRVLWTVFKEDVDQIIDTQPLGTSAILKALRIFNWRRKKSVRVEKVLVDLPTKKATHFCTPIKKLSKRSRRVLKLVSIAPLLEEGETAEEFWQATCGLSDQEIHYEEAYIRQAFRKYRGKPRLPETLHLKIHFKNREELALLQHSYGQGSALAVVHDHEVDFKIAPEDQVITVLLGSQPAIEATIHYVKKMIASAKEFPHIRTHLFVFCADHKEGEESLFKKVAQLAGHCKDYPKNLSIIPFSFQSENVIAPLFYRSDATCTRSGGQTAMELMSVGTGEIWIHSEAKKGQDLLEGIPAWEAASAVYLQRLHDAKIITPETFSLQIRHLYQTSSLPVQSNRDLQSTA